MSDPDVLQQIVRLVAGVLAVPAASLGLDTEGADVEAWNSFGHVRIVLAVEAQFGVQLTMAEIETAASIHGLVAAVEAACRRKADQ